MTPWTMFPASRLTRASSESGTLVAGGDGAGDVDAGQQLVAVGGQDAAVVVRVRSAGMASSLASCHFMRPVGVAAALPSQALVAFTLAAPSSDSPRSSHGLKS